VQLDNDDFVRDQYRTTENLDTRTSVWSAGEPGRSPQDLALLALREVHPGRVLEVGSGKGSLALRIREEIQCDVVALDASSAMVAASTVLGIETIVGDVRDLPFEDGSFDAVVAAWMLYHVSPLDRGLSELSRVLRTGGRLVAITNGRAHLEELWAAVGAVREEPSFSVENGSELLNIYFSDVERRDTATHATFPDMDAAAAYLASIGGSDLVHQLPHSGWPLRARGATAVFLADGPRDLVTGGD
jgi:SAM-dependent methyltransferase